MKCDEMTTEVELQTFIDQWQESDERSKGVFLFFKKLLESLESVILDFVPRAGMTYSLRAKSNKQANRPLFTIVDVIEGEPRWLSVCFYADMVDDPEEIGDLVPGGLLGEDGLCFDVESYDEHKIHYLEERVRQAYEKANR